MKLPTITEYPKELKIGNALYKLRIEAKLPIKKADGLCDYDNKTIWIRDTLPLTEVFNTFVHEVLHAAELEHSIKLSHKVVYQLETFISDFVLSNF